MRLSRIVALVFLGLALGVPAAQAATHLGVPASDHVMLVMGDPDGSPCSLPARHLRRLFPDGTLDDKPFRAPRGKVFIATDVQWEAFGPDLQVGSVLRLRMGLQADNLRVPVFESSGIEVRTESPMGRYGTAESLTAGFVIAPSAILCAELVQATFDEVSNPSLGLILVQGYLADSR